MHENFMDLVPFYQRLRFARASDLAKHWLDIIGLKLVTMVKEQQRKNFIDYIQAGNRLSVKEISMLNTLHKREYI